MSRRPAPAPTALKPETAISPSAVIADTAVLTGKHLITIGANTIIHPRAKLNSTYGPIRLSEGCIVYEKASIGILSARDAQEHGVDLAENVVVEAAAVVEAKVVGGGTTVEAGARVGVGTIVGEYCRITPLSTIGANEGIPDFTVVFASNERRVQKPGLESLRSKTHEKEIEMLKRLIPSNLAKWQS